MCIKILLTKARRRSSLLLAFLAFLTLALLLAFFAKLSLKITIHSFSLACHQVFTLHFDSFMDALFYDLHVPDDGKMVLSA